MTLHRLILSATAQEAKTTGRKKENTHESIALTLVLRPCSSNTAILNPPHSPPPGLISTALTTPSTVSCFSSLPAQPVSPSASTAAAAADDADAEADSSVENASERA